jgi:Tetratricopeptide repeat
VGRAWQPAHHTTAHKSTGSLRDRVSLHGIVVACAAIIHGRRAWPVFYEPYARSWSCASRRRYAAATFRYGSSRRFMPAVAVAGAQRTVVSAATLEVPAKARSEFTRACGEVRAKKLSSAEQRLRKAVQEYPRYAAAWVLLGQVLEAGKRTGEARSACSALPVVCQLVSMPRCRLRKNCRFVSVEENSIFEVPPDGARQHPFFQVAPLLNQVARNKDRPIRHTATARNYGCRAVPFPALESSWRSLRRMSGQNSFTTSVAVS